MDYSERLSVETDRVLRTMRRKGLTDNESAPLSRFAAKRIAQKHLEIARVAILASEYPKIAPKDFKAYWLNSRVRAGTWLILRSDAEKRWSDRRIEQEQYKKLQKAEQERYINEGLNEDDADLLPLDDGMAD